MAENTKLVRFYSGEEPDDRGRFLKQILKWQDHELEYTHDYIQWLFPLKEKSGFNIDAPVVTAATIAAFRKDAVLRMRLRNSLNRMLAFYGMEMSESVPPVVTRSQSFPDQARNWLNASNHNHLRITRILKSPRLLGLEAESAAFFECLKEIYSEEPLKPNRAITETTFRFWHDSQS
jgi:hypothetical protein